MDKHFIDLFAKTAEGAKFISLRVKDAPQVDKEAQAAAASMANIYQTLEDKIKTNFSSLTKDDFGRLLIGTAIVLQQAKIHLEAQEKVCKEYEEQILPRLNLIVKNCKTNEEAQESAEKFFQLIEKNK